jgi:hypothetical protein
MDELLGYYPKQNRQSQDKYCMIHLCELLGVVKVRQTQSRTVVSRIGGEGK